jgi:hypothetical protein
MRKIVPALAAMAAVAWATAACTIVRRGIVEPTGSGGKHGTGGVAPDGAVGGEAGLALTTPEADPFAAQPCGELEPASFYLKAMRAVPPKSAFAPWAAAENAAAGGFRLESAGDEAAVRLDACLDSAEATVKLVRLVVVREAFGGATVRESVVLDEAATAPRLESVGDVALYHVPAARVATAGLKEAVFDRDVSTLAVTLPLPSGRVYSLRGWRLAGLTTAGVTTPAAGAVNVVTLALSEPNGMPAHDSTVIVGALDYGSPFGLDRCLPGEESGTAAFALGLARFKLDVCWFGGGDETIGYRVLRVAVVDTDAGLPATARGETFAVGAKDFDGVFAYRWNPRNACDSFTLRAPYAEYAATAPSGGAACAGLPGAPTRDAGDAERNVRYRVRYGGVGAFREGAQPKCGHHMYWCNG